MISSSSFILDFLILSYAVCASPLPRSAAVDSTSKTGLSHQVLSAMVVGLCISIFAVSLFLAASGCKFYRRRMSTNVSTTRAPYRSEDNNNNDDGLQMQRVPSQIPLTRVDTLPRYDPRVLPAYSLGLRQESVPPAPPFSECPATPPPAHT
ncbi:hypothetical protein EV368DRAFT_86017 [Lentinula lateritia]|uniref:Uncharacterized protein n=1 Tax=Lentinula aff. lateritia TaxID=2804960 RepID=A0ACC1U4P3_9AGAR|nr:hypothetical protein F5876DRAFT_75239 [Lentinula aff. lateritia]KAJ3848965.1 hypothetical protein EV368DRAFT_86017 [Lentinula lateritia]